MVGMVAKCTTAILLWKCFGPALALWRRNRRTPTASGHGKAHGTPLWASTKGVTMSTTNTQTLSPEARLAALEAALAQARAENERLKAGVGKPRSLTYRVSQAGAVSVYGMGRFPVTLYQEQMIKLLDAGDEIREFIKANAASLKKKEPVAAPQA